jgi:hypothetical protein
MALTRDSINEILVSKGLGDKFKCKKILVDGSIDREIDGESNVIHDQDNNPVFDCGWVDWDNRLRQFINSQLP